MKTAGVSSATVLGDRRARCRIIERMSGRRVHVASGRTCHVSSTHLR